MRTTKGFKSNDIWLIRSGEGGEKYFAVSDG
jgi:hypothetical protein